MFVNFSLLKGFHNKTFCYWKCSSSPRISYCRMNHAEICRVNIRKYSAATTFVKNYKYLQQLKKSKIKHFESFRKNFSTSPKLYKENKNPNSPLDVTIFAYIFFCILVFSIYFRVRKFMNENSISWEEFKYEILAKGEVKLLTVFPKEQKVLVELHKGAIFKNESADSRIFVIQIPEIAKFEEKLREAEEELGIAITDRVSVTYHHGSMGKMTISILGVTMTLLLLSAFLMKLVKNIPKDMFSKTAAYTLIDPLMGDSKGVKFSDVAGLKEAKTEIMDFVDYLKRPEIYRSLGAKVPKGALLLGPPGCGKTLLAKAVATEANVPFLSMNGSEFVEIIGGLGAARVRDLFNDAKKRIPCIIYIDEIDAIGKRREDFGGPGEEEQTLNQLLVEMDGVVSNEGVVLLASTNRADVLDKALLRPGRFDRHILIDLPTYQERQEIFEYHLKSVHLENKPEKYSKRLAHLTPGFSGADIANVCNEAALHAARLQKQIVQADDLEYAVERVVGGTEKRSSSRTLEEKKMFAYYEAGRALVGWLSKYGEALLKITIVSRTDTPAGWTHFTPSDKHLYSVEDLRGKMCMGLGGRAAITLLFNRVTTAGEKDLKKVTHLAYAQVRRYGMNPNIGLMSFDVSGEGNLLRKPYSRVLGNMFDFEARKLVADVYKEAEILLLENKDKLIKLAEELLIKETLNYEDVVKLIGPPAFEGKTLVEPLEFIQSLDQAIGPENENNKSS